MDRSTLVLTAADVDALLTIEDTIEAVEDAFGRWGRGEVSEPAVLGFHLSGGGFHIKAASLRRERHYFAAKTNANFPGNPEEHGLPSIQGVIVLADATDGVPLAVIDSIRITELRTAAATAVAARHLARPEAARLALIGCGAQASSQLRAVAAVRRLTEARVVDRRPDVAERFAAEMAAELGFPVHTAADPASAMAAADICVTCTPSRAPVVRTGDLRPGAFLAAVGADAPDKQEVEPELLASCAVVVDSLEQCVEIGELHHAVAAGVMGPDDVRAELGEVVAGTRPGRSTSDETVVFDSTGTAIQDVAAAALVFERASAADRGLRVDLSPA